MNKENKRIFREKLIKVVGAVSVVIISCYMLVPRVWEYSQQKIESMQAIGGRALLMNDREAFAIRQVITKDSSSSRTIMWQSEIEEKDAAVEYRKKGKADIKSALATNEKFIDDKAITYIHTAMLKDLEAGVQYEYRVGYKDNCSEWYELNSDDGGAFKALIFPDSQSNNYSDWKNIARFAKKQNSDVAFFVNMGDLVDNGEDHAQWKAWFEALEGIIDTVPIAPVLGNHETYTQNWKVRMPQSYLHLFSLPENSDPEHQNQFYSFDYGPVHFIVLNTQFAEMEQFQPDLMKKQKKWFINDITKTQKKWKIVLMHKDVLNYAIKNRSDRQAGISDIGKEWMPLFDQYEIDVVLTAHLHTYRRRANLYNFEPDSRGPLYIITGVAGNVRYPNLWVDHPFDKAVAAQPETNNYMTLEASADILHLSSFLPDGKQIDTIEIKK